MFKSIFFSCLLITLSSQHVVLAQQTAPKNPPVSGQLAEYRHLLKEGERVKARDLLRKAIPQIASSEERALLLGELYALNFKILFSREKTDDVDFYVVVPGDNLSVIANRFNSPVDAIKKMNRLESDVIRPGQKLKIWTAKLKIVVDKSENYLYLYANDELFKAYRVATGTDGSTPVGDFKIINKLKNPIWYNANAIVPPDSPENILGTRWMGIDEPGYGIHGTTIPDSIGDHATAGCVRIINREIEELYTFIPHGAQVIIKN